jgi:hypothetical protein
MLQATPTVGVILSLLRPQLSPIIALQGVKWRIEPICIKILKIIPNQHDLTNVGLFCSRTSGACDR